MLYGYSFIFSSGSTILLTSFIQTHFPVLTLHEREFKRAAKTLRAAKNGYFAKQPTVTPESYRRSLEHILPLGCRRPTLHNLKHTQQIKSVGTPPCGGLILTSSEPHVYVTSALILDLPLPLVGCHIVDGTPCVVSLCIAFNLVAVSDLGNFMFQSYILMEWLNTATNHLDCLNTQCSVNVLNAEESSILDITRRSAPKVQSTLGWKYCCTICALFRLVGVPLATRGDVFSWACSGTSSRWCCA